MQVLSVPGHFAYKNCIFIGVIILFCAASIFAQNRVRTEVKPLPPELQKIIRAYVSAYENEDWDTVHGFLKTDESKEALVKRRSKPVQKKVALFLAVRKISSENEMVLYSVNGDWTVHSCVTVLHFNRKLSTAQARIYVYENAGSWLLSGVVFDATKGGLIPCN